MIAVIRNINQKDNGIYLSLKLINKAIKENEIKYSRACRSLYRLCYLDNPMSFDKRMFIKALLQEYKDYKKYFYNNMTGECEFVNIDRLDFVIKKAEIENLDEAFIILLKDFKAVLEAERALEALHDLKNNTFTSSRVKKDVIHVTPRLILNNKGVVDTHFTNGYLPEIRKCFVHTDNEVLISISLLEKIRETLLNKITNGVLQEDIEKHIIDNEAFFLKGFTAVDELQFLKQLMTGDIAAETDFADFLNMEVYSDTYLDEVNVNDVVRKTLYNSIYSDTIDNTHDFLRDEINKLTSVYKNVRPYYITENEIIFAVSNVTVTEADLLNYQVPFETPIRFDGTYIYDYTRETFLPAVNLLNGFSGEYISANEVKNMGLEVTREPVSLIYPVRKGDKLVQDKVLYYNIKDVIQTETRGYLNEVVTNNFKHKFINMYPMERYTERQIWVATSGADTKDKMDFYQYIRSQIFTEFKSLQSNKEYLDYVAEIVSALIYFRYGSSSYNTVYTEYNYITEELYAKACYDAMRLYEKFLN